MFDVGWGELFLIGIVALIVVGPKDLPALFRTVGNFTGKARVMARDFQRTLEQAANESGVSDVSKSLKSFDRSLNSATDSARRYANQTINPARPEPAVPPASMSAAAPGAAPAPGDPGADPLAMPPVTSAPAAGPDAGVASAGVASAEAPAEDTTTRTSAGS